MLHKKLQGTHPIWSLSYDRQGHKVPSQNLAQEVSRALPFVEGAIGEIPEGYLSPFGLVYCRTFGGVVVNIYQEGIIRPPWRQLQ